MFLFFYVFLFFPQVSDSLSLLLYSLHVRLLRASIKINQFNHVLNYFKIILAAERALKLFSK